MLQLLSLQKQIKYMEFQLKDQEHIPLNNLLKTLSLVGTGGDAKIRILEGEVFVKGEECNVISKKFAIGDVVDSGDMELLSIK